LLGGGMYEPILPVLAERDALWQLNRLSDFLEQRFGKRPVGMWCPERVWEPHLAAVLAQAGMHYTLLDDHHFRSSALPEAVKTQYFMTSHAGYEIALYPISKTLRYTMPFQSVKATLDYLKEVATASTSTPLVVFGDDGEKFGVWPDTYEWVYEKGWLSDLFTALYEQRDWIELLLPGEVLERRRPAGTVFIPCASYTEMGEWSRVDPDAKKDDPVGFWRNYFHKYPESYAMYRHGLDLSAQLHALRKSGVPAAELAGAADDLGRSACNCAYWHGVFGGLYLNYLRQAVHHHQLKAERFLHEYATTHGLAADSMAISPGAHRLWGGDIAIQAEEAHGLCVTRIDDLATAFCWSDVLARRREAYHAKLTEVQPAVVEEHASIHDRVVVKEEGLEDKLVVDPHERLSFNTYFCQITSPEQLIRLPKPGEPILKPLFDDNAIVAEGVKATDVSVSGIIDHGLFRIEKTLAMNPGGAEFTVRLKDGMPPSEDIDFMIEFNLTVLTDQSADRYLEVSGKRLPLNEALEWPGGTELRLVDGWRGKSVSISCEQAQRIMAYPVYTVSSSEGGFERTYQGSCILIGCQPVALLSGIHCELVFEDV
jgi:4-alpha-glucanotransferase